jgi:hypothetical protein
MSVFHCSKCTKIFARKLHFDNHINRKTPCVKVVIYSDNEINQNKETDLSPELNQIINDTSKTIYSCKYCNKGYSRQDSLSRHIKQNSCKVKKEINDVYMVEIESLKNKLMEQTTKLNEINENRTNIIQNSNNTINNVTNVTNQINIVSIGKEDMSKLTQEELLKIATSGVFYPIVAAEIIHCNERLPDFQNILISNLRSNKGHIYSIGNWITKNQDDIIRYLMDIDKIHVTNIINDVKVDDEKIKDKIEYTKDELKEDKSHHAGKIKDKLYSASKMISKNKNKKIKDTE